MAYGVGDDYHLTRLCTIFCLLELNMNFFFFFFWVGTLDIINLEVCLYVLWFLYSRTLNFIYTTHCACYLHIASILAIDLVGHTENRHVESRFSFSSLSHQNLPLMILCHLIQPYYHVLSLLLLQTLLQILHQ